MTTAVGLLNEGHRIATCARPRTIGAQAGFSKVPEVTFGFWIIKIAATTLGETGGDAVTMSLHLGYLVGTLIFAAIFACVLVVQIGARRFHPFLYWTVVIASTTVGTTLADFADRSLGIGYVGGSLLLLLAVVASLGLWRWSLGTVSVKSVTNPKVEAFYWITILFSQTLGTALGDFAATSGGLGYAGGALAFGAGLAVTAVLYRATDLSRVMLFWTAFILTRPLGATVGDFLDKPLLQGGLALNRFSASLVLLAFIVACIQIIPQRAADHPGVKG